MITTVFVLMLVIIVLLLIYAAHQQNEFATHLHRVVEEVSKERKEWADERAQLMDRIQAESFREYKTEQTKQIKVLKQEPEAPQQPLL